jgi:hypothetical protein
MSLVNRTTNYHPPLSYEVTMQDRKNRKPVTALLCDSHLETARHKAMCRLTGNVSPAADCVRCQYERAL